MKALRIDTDGKMQTVEITGETISAQNDCIYAMLGGYFDIVRLGGGDALMLVDDEGLLKGLDENCTAMMIANYPMLVGTALIVGLMQTDDGDVFTD
ncbi:MAG: DUF3846 domain-containing protein [Oscillospiraceae bacterium]|nr:DUF3846 domain-containing protein [Oscillospiraceae bacterium]